MTLASNQVPVRRTNRLGVLALAACVIVVGVACWQLMDASVVAPAESNVAQVPRPAVAVPHRPSVAGAATAAPANGAALPADAVSASAGMAIENLDPRIFVASADANRMAAHDDDDSSYTAQEYQEAIERELRSLEQDLGSLQESYAAGRMDEVALRAAIRGLLVDFGEKKTALSNKRLDQSHRFSLRDIVKLHPELADRQ